MFTDINMWWGDGGGYFLIYSPSLILGVLFIFFPILCIDISYKIWLIHMRYLTLQKFQPVFTHTLEFQIYFILQSVVNYVYTLGFMNCLLPNT